MHIQVKWFDNQFNVELYSKPNGDPFLTIKGCRIVNGNKGEFVSWPATKNQNTGKFWNHAYASEAFAQHVLDEAHKARLTQRQNSRGDDDGAPF